MQSTDHALQFMGHPAYRTPMSSRDVGLLDLSRYLFRHHYVPLKHMPAETHDLFLDLVEWAEKQDGGMERDAFFAAAEVEGARLARAASARYASGGEHAR